MKLDEQMASRLAGIALGHVDREYPHKLDHVMAGDEDALPPRTLHPIFYGSFDWHSCVHAWWTMLTLRRLFPESAEADEIALMADDAFTEANVEGEVAYLEHPLSGGFERPYGWAWLLALHREAARHPDSPWAENLEPLARALAGRLSHDLTILTYPIRIGTHFNTAFALILAIEWASEFDSDLETAIRQRAADWFSGDRDCQAWEPGGDEFFSPALVEALCMAITQPPESFASWFDLFLPRVAERQPATLFTPPIVSDRSDGKIAHLDGLSLSRAWCWRLIAPKLDPDRRAIANASADEHLEAALPHLTSDYAGEHWLASFALLALLAEPD